MITSTFLTGIVVANTGIIGFVGLVIPHITRGIVGGNHKKVIPIAIFLGAYRYSDKNTNAITRNTNRSYNFTFRSSILFKYA